MLNIVIPMAGRGSRFLNAGYTVPKPLISIHGTPMIKLVIDNLAPKQPHRFIFICQHEHVVRYDLISKLSRWAPHCEIVPIDGITEGAACTVLHAADQIKEGTGLMIANSDQFIEVSIEKYLEQMHHQNLDGLIMTMQASDPKWSYAALDRLGFVARVAEKEAISPHATVGIYNFRSGRDFLSAAQEMINNGDRTNGEFYVAPVYNYLIQGGSRICIYDIGKEGLRMHGLGTPEDLTRFLQRPIALAATGNDYEDS